MVPRLPVPLSVSTSRRNDARRAMKSTLAQTAHY
jgi:hypothetical protein